jgi:hypothetical protein
MNTYRQKPVSSGVETCGLLICGWIPGQARNDGIAVLRAQDPLEKACWRKDMRITASCSRSDGVTAPRSHLLENNPTKTLRFSERD